MGKLGDWDKVPKDDIIPPGFYNLEVVETEETQSQNTGALMYKVTFRVSDINPANVGRMVFENFVLGTEDDPDPDEYNMESFGVKNMIRMAKAAGVAQTPDPAELFISLRDKTVDVKLGVQTQKDGPFEGRMNNRVQEWHAPGSQELGVFEVKGGRARAAARKQAQPQAPAGAGRSVRRDPDLD